jgi:hypothetical protein
MTCALCDCLLALDNQDPEFPQLCVRCADDVVLAEQPINQPPEEFADDGTQDFTEEDVVS